MLNDTNRNMPLDSPMATTTIQKHRDNNKQYLVEVMAKGNPPISTQQYKHVCQKKFSEIKQEDLPAQPK